MKKYFILLYIASVLFAQEVVRQSDWHGGPGVTGPTTAWGINFKSSTDINYLYERGRISLAAEMNLSPNPTRHKISNQGGSMIQTGDMDDDGDPDVIVGEGISGRISWYENLEKGAFGSENVILTSSYPCFTVADINQDRYADIVATNDRDICWWENDHAGGFIQYLVGSSPDVDAIGYADLDNDGDIDIISSGWSYDETCWWENTGNHRFIKHVIISAYDGEEPGPIKIGDINEDGLLDFIINSQKADRIDWWENDGSLPPDFIGPHMIENDYHNYNHAFDWLWDVNRDGHLDMLTTADVDNMVDWWENDGDGNFIRHNISSSYNGARSIVALDIDYDGDVDIITASEDLNSLALWENDGYQNFTSRTFATDYTHAYGLWVDDVNGNGFLDVLSTSFGLPSVDWWNLFDHFIPSGELISSIIRVGFPVYWSRIEFKTSIPPGTSVEFYVRGGNSVSSMGSWRGPITESGTGLTWDYLDDFYGYLQYKVVLKTTDPDRTPFVYDVEFWYDYIDIGINKLISPPDTVYYDKGVEPSVYIKNYSQLSDAEDIIVYCEIDSAGFDIYKDEKEVEYLACDDSVLVEFEDWVPEGENFEYDLRIEVYESKYADYDDENNVRKMKVFCKKEKTGISESHNRKGIEVRKAGRGIEFINRYDSRVNVSVYDVTGKKIAGTKIGSSKIWKIESIPSGIYFILADTPGGSNTRKFVIF